MVLQPVILFLDTIWNNQLGDPPLWCMMNLQIDGWFLTFHFIHSDVLLPFLKQVIRFGNYYVYDFQTPGLPDYPKYFIWHDAYYFCSNEGSGGSPIYALNRSDMLNGVQTTQLLRWTVPVWCTWFQLASGADWEGSIPPPIGSPAYILRMYDDAMEWRDWSPWNLGIISELVESRKFSVNGPSNLNVTAFDSDVCPGYCAPSQAEEALMVIQQILMHRVQYRNFGTYESMVCNHVIDGWKQETPPRYPMVWARKDGTTPGLYTQEGTVPDADYRFMGSIAQDANGHIALGIVFPVRQFILPWESLHGIQATSGTNDIQWSSNSNRTWRIWWRQDGRLFTWKCRQILLRPALLVYRWIHGSVWMGYSNCKIWNVKGLQWTCDESNYPVRFPQVDWLLLKL